MKRRNHFNIQHLSTRYVQRIRAYVGTGTTTIIKSFRRELPPNQTDPQEKYDENEI